jgi:lipopolysaccharide/colanic/teichoic acid biosynthesis glycosyltransferase
MSVEGPRPHMLQHTLEYKNIVDTYLLRHTVKPGVTGLAQSRGLRGEVHTAQDIKKRVETDIEYIRQWSMLMDLHIIWKTIWLSLKWIRVNKS